MIQFPKRIKNELSEELLPVAKVVLAENVINSEILIGRDWIQPLATPDDGSIAVIKKGGRLILDFGRELNGGIRIVAGIGISRIRLRFGESIHESIGTPNQDHSIHDAELEVPSMGILEYGHTGFRYVCIDALTEITIVNVLALFKFRDLERAGSFKSSDERLTQIWETAVDTVHLCMQDYIYDGIKRDRLAWMGDMNPEITVINQVFNDTSVVKKTLDFVRDNTPLPQVMNGITSYSLWWVITQYEYFMSHNELAYLKEQHEYLSGLMHQYGAYVQDDGTEATPEVRFLDWPTEADKESLHVSLQSLMTWAFRDANKMAVILKDKDLAAFTAGIVAKLEKGVVAPTGRKAPNAIAVLAGLADAVDINKRILSVNPTDDLGTFMGYYTLCARALAGDVENMLQTIKTFWGGMLDCGATSFWEEFDLNWMKNSTAIDEFPVPGKTSIHADFGAYCYMGLRLSLCHGWAGGVASAITKGLTGFEIIEPGFAKVKLAPVTGGLEWYESQIPTPHGNIIVKFGTTMSKPEITLPDGVALA